jgi:ABC-2 type transport system permease protein
MSPVIAVARWEYLDKVRRKSFWIGVFLTPLIWVVMGVVPTMLANKEDGHTKLIGVIDMTDSLTRPLQAHLDFHYKLSTGEPNYALVTVAVDRGQSRDTILRRADAQVREDLLANYLFLPASLLIQGENKRSDSVQYRGLSVSGVRDAERFERAIGAVVLDINLRRAGIDAGSYHAAERTIDLRSVEVSKTGETRQREFLSTFGLAYVFILLLMMMVLMSGQMLVRSLVEEKNTRIIEVLFSSINPRTVMAGKVLGLSAVGMTQVGILLLLGLGVLTQTGFDFSTLAQVPLMLVYFVLGYTLYAAVFVGLGAIVTTEQEAQQVTGYLSLLMVIPIVFIFSAMQNPQDNLLRILSQIPILTPSFMLMRLAVQPPAWWEIALSLCTLTGSIAVVVVVASKVFRIAMLMYGKRPTIGEIIRLARS